jgi:translation elongation factor EF-1alpha
LINAPLRILVIKVEKICGVGTVSMGYVASGTIGINY